MTLSRAVMPLEDRRLLEGAHDPLRATMCGASPEITSPLNLTSPRVGFTKDEISLKMVDLPAPLGPMTERISFGSTSNETSLTAISPP